jgi:ABC-type bacteriocin/lantibiotic exporter with double-glycine peptidase domain
MSDGTGSTSFRDNEPLAVSAAITNAIKTVVLGVVSLALAFGWVHWTNAQFGAVTGVIAAFFVLISAIATSITRRKVTPMANPRAPDGTPLK